jgi:hypothetical protein
MYHDYDFFAWGMNVADGLGDTIKQEPFANPCSSLSWLAACHP